MDLASMLSTAEIRVPIYVILCYVVVITFCLLLSRVRVGLALSFLFVFYIGYFQNRSLILEAMKGSAIGIAIYASLGLGIIILAIVSFFTTPK
jgi:hypothetical protein